MSFKEYDKITIEDQEVTDVPQLVGEYVPHAILMNSNDYGFAVFIIDEKSLQAYEHSMSKINHQMNKSVLLNQLIIMMKELHYPATRLPKILN